MNSNAELRRILNSAQRHDFLTFVTACFREIYGNTIFQEAEYIEYLCHELAKCRDQQPQRLLVCLPPRHLKSFIISICLPAWLLGHNPHLRVILSSYSQEVAEEKGRLTLNIMNGPNYRDVFPHVRIDPAKSSAGEFATNAGGGMYCTSVTGSITGKGADVLILDDPIKAQEGNMRAHLEKLIEYYRQSFYPRLNLKKGGILIINMQRLDLNDLIGILKDEQGYKLISLPAIAEQDDVFELGNGREWHRKKGEALNPQREPLDVLAEIKETMGARAFSAQFQQRPIPDEGMLFRPEYLKTYGLLPVALGTRPTIIMSIDTASKTAAHNDNTAIAIITPYGEQRKATFYVREVKVLKMEILALHQKVTQLAEELHKIGSVTVVIEDCSSGTPLYQMLKNQRRQWHVTTYQPKHSKVDRAQVYEDIFAQGQVQFMFNAPWLGKLSDEFLNFPNGRNDDQVDAVIQGIDWYVSRNVPRIRRF